MTDKKTTKEIPKMENWIDNIGRYNEVQNPPVRVLLYGEPGSGKTQFAGTAPMPFFLDSDKGGLTLRKQDIPFLPLIRGERTYEILMKVLSAIRKKEKPFDEDGYQVETIVFDSLTSLADCIITESMLFPGPGRASKNPTYNKPEWDDYASVLGKMKNLMKKVQDFGLNIVATCGVKLEKDEIRGTFVGRPNIVGSYREIVGHDFDEELFMEVRGDGKSTKFITHTKSYLYYVAKSRWGEVQPEIEDATFNKLYKEEGKE